MDKPKEPRQVDNNESVFAIVERLVESVRIIAEMQKIGDADQVRQYELDKLLLAHLITLAESISQSLLDFDETPATREMLLADMADIIVSQQDLLSAKSTSIYDRDINMQLMDVYADKNATAIFVTRNFRAYGFNHVPTVRVIIRELNLAVVTKAAREESEIRVRELIEALYEGIAR